MFRMIITIIIIVFIIRICCFSLSSMAFGAPTDREGYAADH